jgi:3-methylcrotonyl-CoA carboxylase alpha subunit
VRFLNSPRPIRSVLIANRGEIAVRVVRTCKQSGIRSIAIYSDADADSVHVRIADDAVRVGPSPARQSYLDMDAVMAAAQQTGADAIHPGYGFLSENATFVRRCERAGVIFIGPSATAVERMGSKIESKRIAEAAGVPTVPGYHGDLQDAKALIVEAERIGFPVLIKASAGGGGRGMRRVDRPHDFADALASAKAEAEAAFGDDSILLEKFILNPRHLEVQVAGDRHGNLVHLFERDCSVQRNHQKVLEEAPAPNLSEDVRSKLYDAALKLGRAISYDSAGTVEFIMDAGSDQPYFLEMNTRLQVEHPVTELITGLDLVEWQLIAASGEPLPLKQDEIHARGHAIEARITAERPDLGFRPASGELVAVDAPRGLRFDAGVAAGSEVSLYYDSLLAKAIAHAADRPTALRRLHAGLSELAILGVPTTQAFLRDAIAHPLFRDGNMTTRFIETAFPGNWKPDASELRALRAAACAAWSEPRVGDATPSWISPWHQRSAIRVASAVQPAHLTLRIAEEYGEAEAEVQIGRHEIAVAIDGEAVTFARPRAMGEIKRIASDGQGSYAMHWREHVLYIAHNGLALAASIQPKIDMSLSTGHVDEHSGSAIAAPLHGVVSKLYLNVGDSVEKGAPILQMEAMKLIHTLNAPVQGRISAIRCKVGETVPADALLVEIEPSAAG